MKKKTTAVRAQSRGGDGGGKEHLSEDAPDAGQRQAPVVGPDDPPQQLVAQHLQDHAHVC